MPKIDDGGPFADQMSPWPLGGGDMGARIRAYDWGSTSLGMSHVWQQNLKSSIDFMLNVGFPMMVMAGTGLVQIYNDAYAEFMADEHGEELGLPIRDSLPRFLETEPSLLDRVLAGETVTWANSRHPIPYRGRGADRWFNATLSPAKDSTGIIFGAVLIAFDVTGYILAERQLAGELQHRVRNSLSVIRSIARRTAENSETLDEFADHLDGRLEAFARAQGSTVTFPAQYADLTMLIVDELAAVAIQEGELLLLSGPDVSLQSKAAEALGMAFHELTTNAIKYGAFAVEGGSIAVSWSIDGEGDDGRLTIIWKERRPGPALPPPTHHGFGTELLERTLSYELEAETVLDYAPTGLRCTIIVPLAICVFTEP